jgi:CRISPR/Cas system-associated exonuclease Cas4 (RecB family)
MKPILTLSRAMLDSFKVCQRRFQLRYLEAVPWPALSLEPEIEMARDLGNRFHQMLNRHFLGLPVTAGEAIDPELDRWWKLFREWEPTLPDGRRYSEFTLTVPVGNHFVVGRLDLLIITEGQVHIFDWKTSARPRSANHLWNDLQTQLYLTMVVEGAGSIGKALNPADLSLTYWYSGNRPETVQLRYDATKHRRFWIEIQEIVSQIDAMIGNKKTWPLTSDHSRCERCPYQIICNRQADAVDLSDWDVMETGSGMEPEWF